MTNIITMYRHLPKNIYIMFFVRFINAFGDFVIPFLSLYLTLKLGYSTVFAGSIVTIAVLIKIPGSMCGGILADHWSKKGTYLLAQGSAAFCILLCGFLQNRHFLILLLLLSAFFGSAVRPVLSAFVYDLVPEKDRKTAYSFLYMGINVGVSVGPLLSGFLFKNYLTLFFVTDALTSFIAVFLVAFFVQIQPLTNKTARTDATPKTDTMSKTDGKPNTGEFLKSLFSNPKLSLFFALYLFMGFIYSQHSFSLPLMLKELYSEKSSIYFGYLMSVNAITCVTSTTFVTYFTRKKSLLFNISLAGIFMGVGFGILAIYPHPLIFIVSTILWTIGEVLLSTNVGIYVVEQSDIRMRTRSTAFQTIIDAAGSSLGVFSMGLVITNWGINVVWPIIFILGICVFLSFQVFEKSRIFKKDKSKSLI